MIAMLWKELRENFKWGILAMIGLGLAEIYGLYYYDPSNYNSRGTTLCSPTFLMATSFGNALVGLVLGFIQILPEQRRDQWAALIHRPVSRAVILRGKVLGGLVLYVMATVPPFLLCVWLAATPGHFAQPFVPNLILPGASDICVGVSFYFAALLVALQRGSWFGARTMGLLAAVYLTANLSTVRYFFVAVEASVIMSLFLFAAGWGAILSNGKFADRPWLARFALLVSVFYGLCGLGILASGLIKAGQGRDLSAPSEYILTQEGEPLFIKAHRDMTSTTTDLAGNVIHDERYTGARGYQNRLFLYQLTLFVGDTHGDNPHRQYYNYRLSYEYVTEVQQVGISLSPIRWFYLLQSRYAVGVDARSKEVVRVADRSGFKPAGAAIEPFTGTQQEWFESPALVQEGTQATIYDLDKETTMPLLSADLSPIAGFQHYSYDGPGGLNELIVLARADAVQAYDSQGKLVITLPYRSPLNLDRWGTISFAFSSVLNRYFIEYSPSQWMPRSQQESMPSFLDVFDAQGKVTTSYTLPPFTEDPFPRTWQVYLSESLGSPAFLLWNLSYQKVGAAFGIKHLVRWVDYSFHNDWEHTKDIARRVTFYSLVFALVALVWARSVGMSWPRVWAWTAFTLAFNLAGLITFRMVADWPVRVRCPECGRPRSIEETNCPHCHAGWPPPPRSAIDIFDHSATPAAQEV